MKNLSKKAKKITKIFLLAIVSILLFVLFSLISWNTGKNLKENKNLKPLKQIVNAEHKINTSVSGNGTHTIILLSGLGTYSPIIDFEPLSDRLSKDFTVVTIEYPGYGLSPDTNDSRTCADFVSDIRSTMQALNIKPPYILMPHSISGIYALEYIREYPEEVEALIGIEPSIPEQCEYEPDEKIPALLYVPSRIFDFTGLTRVELNSDAMLADMQSCNTYTKEQLFDIKAIKSRRGASMALIHENNAIHDNFASLETFAYPENLPVLTFLGDKSCHLLDQTYQEAGYDATWKGMHENMITNPDIQKITLLSGEHYLHWTNADPIANQTASFITSQLH